MTHGTHFSGTRHVDAVIEVGFLERLSGVMLRCPRPHSWSQDSASCLSRVDRPPAQWKSEDTAKVDLIKGTAHILTQRLTLRSQGEPSRIPGVSGPFSLQEQLAGLTTGYRAVRGREESRVFAYVLLPHRPAKSLVYHRGFAA